jgi:invasion protein IalB
MMRYTALTLALLTGLPATAETTTPTATTATYGNWTVGCSVVAQADGTAPKPLCEMTTRLNLKGQDGQMRPLLAWTIGTPPGAKSKRIALQVPVAVALRQGVIVSLDKAAADAATPKPQDELAVLTYVTCTPQACVADADATDELLGKLKAAKTANVSFTLLQGAKEIMVPVSLDGFSDALAALDANGR